MLVSMTSTPDVIARYFAASEAGDIDALVACFTDDAWVVDEARRHEGTDAIRAWREGTSASYTYTLQITGVTETASSELTVDTHLEGDFPGGVVDLKQIFGLSDGLISSLHI